MAGTATQTEHQDYASKSGTVRDEMIANYLGEMFGWGFCDEKDILQLETRQNPTDIAAENIDLPRVHQGMYLRT